MRCGIAEVIHWTTYWEQTTERLSVYLLLTLMISGLASNCFLLAWEKIHVQSVVSPECVLNRWCFCTIVKRKNLKSDYIVSWGPSVYNNRNLLSHISEKRLAGKRKLNWQMLVIVGPGAGSQVPGNSLHKSLWLYLKFSIIKPFLKVLLLFYRWT